MIRQRVEEVLALIIFLPAFALFVSFALVLGPALLVFVAAFVFFLFFFYLLPCVTGVMEWKEPFEIMRWRSKFIKNPSSERKEVWRI